MSRPRFLLTANLQKLAKWLRFLGYDAAVRVEADFDSLVAQAARQRRILLTRSEQQSRDPRRFRRQRILSVQHTEQLRELASLLEFSESKLLTRCGECNRLLRPAAREQVIGRVPEHVAATAIEFRVCTHCKRVYWQGNHWREIHDLLVRALQ